MPITSSASTPSMLISGMPLISIEGVEADDVIGTYALQASKNQQSVIISTGDKDIAQLVNEHISLVNTMTDTHLDREGVISKFGMPNLLITPSRSR